MINLMNLFGGGQMGTSLFGAPKMFNDMPEPGILGTGGPDGVAPPTPPAPLLADMPAAGASMTGLGGADKDFFVPPGSEGAKPPPAGVPMPVPQPSLKPIPPSAASQLPAPLTGPGSDKATAATPAQGGVGPNQPIVANPATTGSTPPANTTPAAAEGAKQNTLKDFLERAGQVKFGEGGGAAGVKPANIGSAGQPHIPQGASQLFQSIMEGHQKSMPQVAKVPDMSAIMQRLGLVR
jgi:hypothetical protein